MTVETIAAWASAIAAVAAASAAFASLPFTRRAANAAKAQTQLQADIAAESRRPLLWADIREHPEHRSIVCLLVGNKGLTTARNVRVTIEPAMVPGTQPLHCERGQTTAAAGISAIPPGRTLEWWMGVGHELMAVPDQPEEFTLTISATAADGTPLSDQFVVPFADLRFTSASPGNVESFVQEFKHFRRERSQGDRNLLRALTALAPENPEARDA